MKFMKLILITMVLMLLFISATPFAIKCPYCWKKDHITSVANRSIKDEKSGDTRAVYRCQYGHIIYKDYQTKD